MFLLSFDCRGAFRSRDTHCSNLYEPRNKSLKLFHGSSVKQILTKLNKNKETSASSSYETKVVHTIREHRTRVLVAASDSSICFPLSVPWFSNDGEPRNCVTIVDRQSRFSYRNSSVGFPRTDDGTKQIPPANRSSHILIGRLEKVPTWTDLFVGWPR